MEKQNADRAQAQEIGDRVRQRRQELGLSMRQLAGRLGVNPSTIRRYETEGVNPRKSYLLISLADQLDTDTDWLLGHELQQPGARRGVSAGYQRQLSQRTGYFLQSLKKSELSEEQQTLMVGILGCFIDHFSVLAAHYAKAIRDIADIQIDENLSGPLSHYQLRAGDVADQIFQREMREPVAGLRAMAECLLHLRDREMRENYASLLAAASDGRPMRRGRGSIRQRGGHWYYRFYMKDENGRPIQREFAGGENRLETETMLRRAMMDYAEGNLRFRADRITLGELLDIWMEELKVSSKSNGTLMLYQGVVNRIKQHPIGRRKLRSITSDALQQYIDALCFGSEETRMLSTGYVRVYQAVLQGAFRFAVFPGKLLVHNPMQYVIRREKPPETVLFESEEERMETVTHGEFLALCEGLQGHPALLPVQISYYTGMRLGEVCALTWQDIDLKEQCVTVRRSIRYNGATHRIELSTTKRAKIRTVAFGDTLASLLRTARQRAENTVRRVRCCYHIATDKGRRHYVLEQLPQDEELPEEFLPLDFVCVKADGSFTSPDLVEKTCKKRAARIPGMENFHFHMLRHTYTTNLLKNGASPKDVQELLGHSNVTTTMNVYAHSTTEAKRSSARLLDNISDKV